MNSHENSDSFVAPPLPDAPLLLTVPERDAVVRPDRGFTLVELVVVCAVLAVLAAMAVYSFPVYQDRAKNARAMAEIRTLEKAIQGYYADRGTFPPDLATVGYGSLLDPWGKPYNYGIPGTRTLAGAPINADFDLWSDGSNKNFAPSIAQGNDASQDDIIRKSEGSWVGVVYQLWIL